MKNLHIPLTLQIPAEDIENLLVSAFEGGSNYWIDRVDVKGKTPKKSQFLSDVPFMGGTLVLKLSEEALDDGTKDKSTFTLDIKTIVKGMKAWADSKEMAHHFADFIKGDCDAITGDVFLQFCLFGEVIYG